MDSKIWQMWKSFWNAAPGSPAAVSSASEWAGYPQTFAKLPPDARLARPKLFEPALQHYPRGFRLGEPTFRDPEIGRQWFAARRRVTSRYWWVRLPGKIRCSCAAAIC